eukprot:6297781-Lingulodinium_polyedra.AAC.1
MLLAPRFYAPCTAQPGASIWRFQRPSTSFASGVKGRSGGGRPTPAVAPPQALLHGVSAPSPC